MTQQKKLCIVSPWNYPLFNSEVQTHFGGWEVRIALIAKEIAIRGAFAISLLVADHCQPHIEIRSNVKLYSWTGRQIWGVPYCSKREKKLVIKKNSIYAISHTLFRIIFSYIKKRKLKSLKSGKIGTIEINADSISICDEIDADVYMVPGNSQFSCEIAFYCNQRGKKFVLLAGSDMDFYPEYKERPKDKDIYGLSYAAKTYAIEKAHLLIAQNEKQVKMLREGYNLDAVLIKNPIDLRQKFERLFATQIILWVGKSDERIKRPSIILELARRLPEFTFIIILNPTIYDIYKDCEQKACLLENVTLIDRVPFNEIERYFSEAALHVNTSKFEGFPNTFLQAAKYGVPTISANVDPGNMLSTHGCGVCCDDNIELLLKNIKLFMSNSEIYNKATACCHQYIEKHHDKNKIILQYENALLSIL